MPEFEVKLHTTTRTTTVVVDGNLMDVLLLVLEGGVLMDDIKSISDVNNEEDDS